MTISKTKSGTGQKRAGCREVASDFSFLCVLCGSALLSSTAARKSTAKRRSQ